MLFFFSCDFTPRIHKEVLHIGELISKQEYIQAIEQYKKILARNPPERAKIQYQIGEIYSIYLLKYKEAVKFYRKSIESAEDPLWMIKSQEKIGEINFSFIKDYEEATKDYRKLVEFVPKLEKYDFYQYRMARSYLNAGRPEGYKILQLIIKNSNHKYYTQGIFQMGMYHFLRKEWEKAIEHWNLYVKVEKRNNYITQTKFLIANAYEMMNDLQNSYDIYYSILTKYPNMEVVRNRLQSIYVRKSIGKR
ncbi:MAG: tetratricopeptide repeat protein [Halobacteriovoraceae bacterium]|nr:tetratricopeptide repeat protein [Halobacteriovoraceae bacterium]